MDTDNRMQACITPKEKFVITETFESVGDKSQLLVLSCEYHCNVLEG